VPHMTTTARGLARLIHRVCSRTSCSGDSSRVQ
jgi:hypothetical protein